MSFCAARLQGLYSTLNPKPWRFSKGIGADWGILKVHAMRRYTSVEVICKIGRVQVLNIIELLGLFRYQKPIKKDYPQGPPKP